MQPSLLGQPTSQKLAIVGWHWWLKYSEGRSCDGIIKCMRLVVVLWATNRDNGNGIVGKCLCNV